MEQKESEEELIETLNLHSSVNFFTKKKNTIIRRRRRRKKIEI